MHSSRMRTVRCSGRLGGAGVCPWEGGGSAWRVSNFIINIEMKLEFSYSQVLPIVIVWRVTGTGN